MDNTLNTDDPKQGEIMALASLFTTQTAQAIRPETTKTEVTLLLDTELTDRVKAMKSVLKKQTGCYFSLSQVCETAIESALRQAESELKKSRQSGDEITML